MDGVWLRAPKKTAPRRMALRLVAESGPFSPGGADTLASLLFGFLSHKWVSRSWTLPYGLAWAN